MKLGKGDKIKVHGNLDIPLEDGFTYELTGTEGARYVFACIDTGTTVQAAAPSVDKFIGTEMTIERV